MRAVIQTYKNRIRNTYRGRSSKNEMLLLEGAFLDIEQLYRGQYRYSGLPVVLHSLRVGFLLCQIGADIRTTIAGLLHDVLEDTPVTRQEIRQAYGPWYSKVSSSLKKTQNRHQTHQKLLQAGQYDIRNLTIKFCDRLDNMREIGWLPETKRRRISLESLSFYLPFASKIGIPGEMRDELKSLASVHC